MTGEATGPMLTRAAPLRRDAVLLFVTRANLLRTVEPFYAAMPRKDQSGLPERRSRLEGYPLPAWPMAMPEKTTPAGGGGPAGVVCVADTREEVGAGLSVVHWEEVDPDGILQSVNIR